MDDDNLLFSLIYLSHVHSLDSHVELHSFYSLIFISKVFLVFFLLDINAYKVDFYC